MTLIKTSILSGFASIIQIIASFISVKIVAIYIGPSGLALVGQMQSFISMISTISSAGVNNGVVKYTSENNDNEVEKQKIWTSALRLLLIFTVPIAIAVIILSDFISMKLLHTTEYSSIFVLFAFSIVFFVLNGVLTSILNGQKEIKKLTILNIVGSIVGLIITIFLIINLNLYGALIVGIISQSILFFITLLFVVRSNWFKISMFFGNVDKKYIHKLLKYSAMALLSALVVPLSHIYIRNYLGTNIGWNEAGYWQAIWRISETYLMLITTTLSIYYLPKLASIESKIELRRELLYGYKIIMPIAIILALGIFFFKDIIIHLLFTSAFSPMMELFLYQLVGDVVKIAAWLLAYIMIAKAMTKLFIITEIIFSFSFIAFVVFFVDMYGLIGVTIAFAVNYILYFIFIYFALRGYLYED